MEPNLLYTDLSKTINDLTPPHLRMTTSSVRDKFTHLKGTSTPLVASGFRDALPLPVFDPAAAIQAANHPFTAKLLEYSPLKRGISPASVAASVYTKTEEHGLMQGLTEVAKDITGAYLLTQLLGSTAVGRLALLGGLTDLADHEQALHEGIARGKETLQQNRKAALSLDPPMSPEGAAFLADTIVDVLATAGRCVQAIVKPMTSELKPSL